MTKPDPLKVPDFRGIDACTASEWLDLIRCGHVPPGTMLFRCEDAALAMTPHEERIRLAREGK